VASHHQPGLAARHQSRQPRRQIRRPRRRVRRWWRGTAHSRGRLFRCVAATAGSRSCSSASRAVWTSQRTWPCKRKGHSVGDVGRRCGTA